MLSPCQQLPLHHVKGRLKPSSNLRDLLPLTKIEDNGV